MYAQGYPGGLATNCLNIEPRLLLKPKDPKHEPANLTAVSPKPSRPKPVTHLFGPYDSVNTGALGPRSMLQEENPDFDHPSYDPGYDVNVASLRRHVVKVRSQLVWWHTNRNSAAFTISAIQRADLMRRAQRPRTSLKKFLRGVSS